ncbi:DEAD/DEAH box helicase [Streptomyces sp. NPDC058000]|uniref:DEAD/DEAH box helicase n=1 Tax=Streptomyces sp. NPDC058000 TaxID=3346299 RepID=UPI0036E2EA4D
MPVGLLKTLTAQGVTTPFPIQAATLPNSLAGRDLLGRGRTGSGKTLAFGLALLARTAGLRAEPKAPLALVLVPTRELAQQVADALTPYATAVNLRLTTVVGGLSIMKQAGALRRGVEVLVATPGRLNDLVERGDCRLDGVRITVLDEADQMTDMGFLPQITKVIGDPPTDHKVHRGGRTARAGGSGSVVTLVLPNQKRDVTQLMSAAGIRPRTARITSSDAELTTITGAREPSGVAVTIEVPQPATPTASRPDRETGTKPGRRSGRRRRNGGGAKAAPGAATGTGGRGSDRRAAAGSATAGGTSATGGRGCAHRAGSGGATGGAVGVRGGSSDRRAATGAACGKAVRGSGRRSAASGATGGAVGTGGRGSDRRSGRRGR